MGTVCDDVWNTIDTNEDQAAGLWLGQGGPWRCAVWSGLGPIVLDDVRRSGHESYLWSCPHGGWKSHNSNHGEGAGVICPGGPLTWPGPLLGTGDTSQEREASGLRSPLECQGTGPSLSPH